MVEISKIEGEIKLMSKKFDYFFRALRVIVLVLTIVCGPFSTTAAKGND